MRKLLNKPWFVVLLAVAAIAVVWSAISPNSTQGTGPIAAPAPEEALASTGSPETLPDGLPHVAATDSLKQLPAPKPTRDPFAPKNTPTPTQSTEPTSQEPEAVDTAHLSALWNQNGVTLAVVNNRICRIGDSIGRLTIESAAPNGIWLSHWKGRTLLETGNTFTLKTPARISANLSSP
ncbi:MAG: hypothetical protein QM790_02370 [Nibricoccus sp.]